MSFSTEKIQVSKNQIAGLLGAPVTISNKASGGAIAASAALSVDTYSTFNCAQTTANQTLTVPDPTDTTAGLTKFINNTGSAAFTMLSTTVAAGKGMIIQWDGDSWNPLVSDSVTSAFAGAVTSSSASAGIGYSAGAGSTVVQGTNRTTAVVINAVSGSITLFSAAGSATPATFTVTNSAMGANDLVILNQKSGTDKLELFVTAKADGSFAITFFTTGGTTTEAPVISFAILKGVVE